MYRVRNKDKEPQVLEVGVVVPPESLGLERAWEELPGAEIVLFVDLNYSHMGAVTMY